MDFLCLGFVISNAVKEAVKVRQGWRLRKGQTIQLGRGSPALSISIDLK
jgi:hypothetical protein